jgi:hypothetical protein
MAMPAAAWLNQGAPAPAAAVNLEGPVARAAATPMANVRHAAPPATSSSTQAIAVRGNATGRGSPTAETPEDTQIVSATASPHFAQDSTVVALGWGDTCGCNVVLRSTDGGATWTSRPGPPDGDQLVLPPDYPRDPRIFVGYADEIAGAADYWAPAFGRYFRPLAMPAGALALSAGFDSGDERVIVSSRNGIWGLDWTTHVVQPLVVDPDLSGTPAITAPVGALTTGVLAITSSAAISATTITNALNSSPNLELWSCPPGQGCNATGSVPLDSEARLSASPGFAVDHTILAYTRSRVVLSRDGGGSFQAMPLPPGSGPVNRVALGFPVDGRVPVWMLVQRGRYRFALEFAPSPSGPWSTVDGGLPQITNGDGTLLAVGPDRLIYLSSSTGFVCTANDGLSWSTRCPIA